MQKTIVIVEDDIVLNRIWDKHLTREGFVVKVFANGADAFNYMQKTACDLMVLNIQSEQVDALKLLFDIKKQFGKLIPIVGIVNNEEFKRSAKHMVTDCLVLPFWSCQLSFRINRLFSLQAS